MAEHIVTPEGNVVALAKARPTENAVWVGVGRVMASIPNIGTTDDMVGLSVGSS